MKNIYYLEKIRNPINGYPCLEFSECTLLQEDNKFVSIINNPIPKVFNSIEEMVSFIRSDTKLLKEILTNKKSNSIWYNIIETNSIGNKRRSNININLYFD